MPFPLAGAGIAAGVGGVTGLLSNIFGKNKKEWSGADLAKYGWQDYDPNEANKFLLRNASTLINRRRRNTNSKAAQYGMDPISSSYQGEDDIMDSVFGQAGDIYTKGVESSQNKAKMLTEMNFAEEQNDTGIFDDIFAGAGMGLNAFSKFYKAKDGRIMPNDPSVPDNVDVFPAMLSKNEGVLNSEAMKIPGVREFVKKLNRAGLSLRDRMGGGNSPSPLSRGQRGDVLHYSDGGEVPKEAVRSDKRKKSRKGKGISLSEIFDPSKIDYNTVLDFSKEFGDELSPNVLDIFQKLQNETNKSSKEYYPSLNEQEVFNLLGMMQNAPYFQKERGLQISPISGSNMEIGEIPTKEELMIGIAGKVTNPLSFAGSRIHTHPGPTSEDPSNQDLINSSRTNSYNYVSNPEDIVQYDRSGVLKRWELKTGKKKDRDKRTLMVPGFEEYNYNLPRN